MYRLGAASAMPIPQIATKVSNKGKYFFFEQSFGRLPLLGRVRQKGCSDKNSGSKADEMAKIPHIGDSSSESRWLER
jgi:hypothetical protein